MTLLALFLIEIFCYRCLLATAYCTFSQTNHSLQSGHWCSPSGCSQFFSIWTDILNFLKHLRWNSLCLAFLTTESVMQRLRQALCIVDILEAVHSLPKVHYDLFSLRWSSGGGFCLDINIDIYLLCCVVSKLALMVCVHEVQESTQNAALGCSNIKSVTDKFHRG